MSSLHACHAGLACQVLQMIAADENFSTSPTGQQEARHEALAWPALFAQGSNNV